MVKQINKVKKRKEKNLFFSLLCLVTFVLVGCAKVPLYTNLPEKSVNEMMAVLSSRGIECQKQPGEDNSWSMSIEADKVAEAIEILHRYGLPKDRYETIGMVFKKSGLVSSPTEERIRFMYALSQGVAETITQIDGVLVARVHVVLQNNDPLSNIQTPSSASVFIKYRRGSGVDRLSSQIKRLVTNSIEGLKYEKVSIVFVPSDAAETGIQSTENSEQIDFEVEGNAVSGWFTMRSIFILALIILLIILIAASIWYWFTQVNRSGTDTLKRPSVGSEKAEKGAKKEEEES